jgi:replication factor A1
MDNCEILIERISEVSGLPKEEIEKKIEAKKAKLSGLISGEGAAQIIASEMGVNFENVDLKIKELMSGMRKANVCGKIISLFPVREYERNGSKNKVANMIIADETGNARVVLWDTNLISKLESGEISQGDVVEVKNASVRDNELHLSGFSEFNKSTKVLENVKTERSTEKKDLKDVKNGESVKIRGLVVQLFPPRFFKGLT